MTTSERDLLEKAAETLGEHWDAVQILVSRGAEEGGTEMADRGSGNWYARQGMCHKFITRDEADELASTIANAKNDEDSL